MLRSFEAHSGGRLPLSSYAALVGVYCAGIGGSVVAAATRKRARAPGAGDLTLVTIATFALARVVSRDRVAAPFRAPFTRYVGPAGEGEVEETARGSGLQRALGELVTCPFCVAPWIAGTLIGAFSFAPRATRAVASVFAVVAGADLLQHVHARVKRRADASST